MKNLKKEFNRIEKVFKHLNLEQIEEIGTTFFLNNETIYAKTPSNIYLIDIVPLKEQGLNFSKKRMAKIKSLEDFDKNGVHSLFPMSFNDKYFIDYRGQEYAIYKYIPMEHLSVNDISEKMLKKIANTQAIIHNLNIKNDIECEYQEINIDFGTKISKLEKYSKDAFDLIYEYIYQLKDIVDQNNKLLKYAKNHLVVGYDNYNLNNIEWVKEYMFLADYNNCKLINPTVSLAESAYDFCVVNNEVNYPKYQKYLSVYLKKYKTVTFDYKEALYVSQNKRLKDLENLIKQSIKRKENNSSSIINLIEEILFYNSNIEKMYEAYLKVVKKESTQEE